MCSSGAQRNNLKLLGPKLEAITRSSNHHMSLKAYHMAVTLDQVKHWWRNSSDKQWVSIEAGMVNITNWQVEISGFG